MCNILGYDGADSSSISQYSRDVNYRLIFINCSGSKQIYLTVLTLFTHLATVQLMSMFTLVVLLVSSVNNCSMSVHCIL